MYFKVNWLVTSSFNCGYIDFFGVIFERKIPAKTSMCVDNKLTDR